MNTRIQLALIASLSAVVHCGLAQEEVVKVQIEETILEAESNIRDAEVEVLDYRDLDLIMADGSEDVVRYIPGVSVTKGDDRWGSSGYNIRGLDEDRVAINVDGVPQGETLKYEVGQAYGYFRGSRNGVDIEALKSVEVVKGADSIFSGSGALAGAVNFKTKDPADFLLTEGNDTHVGLKTGYSGVNDELMGTFSFANRVGQFESMAIYTRREGHEYESYDMDGADVEGSAREIPDPQDVTLDSLLVKLDYLAGESQKLGFVYSYYERNSVTDAQSYNSGWYTNRVGDDYSETNRIGLTYDWKPYNVLFDTMKASLNRQSVDFAANTAQYVYIAFGPSPSVDEDRVDTRVFAQDTDQLKVDFSKEVGGDAIFHNLLYGFEYQMKDYENTQYRTSNSNLNDDGLVERNIGALIPASDADVYTLYGVDSIELGNRSKLRIGARYDDYTYNAYSNDDYGDGTGTLGETNFSALTWSAGFEQTLTETLIASVGVSTGFRAPTIEEMYSVSGAIDDWNTVANPELEAESSTNFDVSISGNYSAGSFRLGYFDSQYDDFIEYVDLEGVNPNRPAEDPIDPNGYNMPMNVGEVEISGIEFSGYLDLSEAFGWEQRGYGASLNAAYTEGEEANGDPLYTVQPYSMTLGLSYAQAEGRWGANFYTTYTSGKDASDAYKTQEDGSVIYPLYLSNSATVLDLTVFYNVTENLRLAAGVYNLTDKEYYHWDSVRFIDLGDFRPGIGVSGNGVRRYSEPGRNFKLSASYVF